MIIKLLLKFYRNEKSEVDFKKQVRCAGYFFCDEIEPYNFKGDNFWESYHKMYVFKRIGLESFGAILKRNGLTEIKGMAEINKLWYGYYSINDAYTVFKETINLSDDKIYLIISD